MLEDNQVSEATYSQAFLVLLHFKDNELSLLFSYFCSEYSQW